MKRFKIFLIILFSGLLITSCNKSDSTRYDEQKTVDQKTLLSNPAYRQGIMDAILNLQGQTSETKGAEFLPVFFLAEGFGFFDDSGTKLVTFSAIMDGDDFLRENPDGTYTVHMTSNEAISELQDYISGEYYFGTNGHMVMNYSGPALLTPISV